MRPILIFPKKPISTLFEVHRSNLNFTVRFLEDSFRYKRCEIRRNRECRNCCGAADTKVGIG